MGKELKKIFQWFQTLLKKIKAKIEIQWRAE